MCALQGPWAIQLFPKIHTSQNHTFCQLELSHLILPPRSKMSITSDGRDEVPHHVKEKVCLFALTCRFE